MLYNTLALLTLGQFLSLFISIHAMIFHLPRHNDISLTPCPRDPNALTDLEMPKSLRRKVLIDPSIGLPSDIRCSKLGGSSHGIAGESNNKPLYME